MEQFGCAFPSASTTTDPFYPLFSGGVAALASIGHAVPFPPQAALGPRCDRAVSVINRWSMEAGAWPQTFEIGYLSILPLLAGVVAVLRTIGRGRRRWEPATVVTVALLPPVWLCVEGTFHPEDLFAMGFSLLAIASARRTAWAWAGLWVGLALVAQPFALLVATPLVGPGTGAQPPSIRWIRPDVPGGDFAPPGCRWFRTGQGRVPSPAPDRNTEWFDERFHQWNRRVGAPSHPAPCWWWCPEFFRLRLPSSWRAGSGDVSARGASNPWFSCR